VIVTVVFAGVVVAAASHHEPWRDEVVPLSIARQAGSLAELAAPLAFEGHPILWYLVLWCAWGLVGSPWVLKAASLGSAIGAVFLLQRSPLPWWLAGLFTFSFFPLYQYSVVSRGYALEMLVLFACCAVVPHRRTHPLALGVGLALLANTEAFGAVMAVALAVALFVDAVVTAPRALRLTVGRAAAAGGLVFAAGLVLAVAIAYPDAGHRGTAVRGLDVGALAGGIGRALADPIAHSTRLAVVPLPSLWVWALLAYLLPTPALLCFTALSLVGIEAIFNLAHGPGASWHIGNVVLVLVATLWLHAADTFATRPLGARVARVRRGLGSILVAGVAVVFAEHAWRAADRILADRRHPYSSNRHLAQVLRGDPTLANAVVMGEPDPPLWSVPYYSDHRIYLAREDAFRSWGIFAPPRRVEYDLGALLAAARRVRDDCGCPVVITMGWPLSELGVHTNFPATRFQETFVVSPADRDAFLAAVYPLAPRAPAITDESYDVFVLR
jgi:hypothetical protein